MRVVFLVVYLAMVDIHIFPRANRHLFYSLLLLFRKYYYYYTIFMFQLKCHKVAFKILLIFIDVQCGVVRCMEIIIININKLDDVDDNHL